MGDAAEISYKKYAAVENFPRIASFKYDERRSKGVRMTATFQLCIKLEQTVLTARMYWNIIFF